MAHNNNDNTPHKGEEKLVVAIDLGTTHTAVSYVYLYPGDLPEVKMVTKWPGQPAASGDSKIPTIIAYQNGAPMAFGVEAEDFIGDSDYEIAKWFKLYLHPDHMKLSNSEQPPAYGSHMEGNISAGTGGMEIPPLPTNITLQKVYIDFLNYLHTRTREFFGSSTLNGSAIWNRLFLKGKLIVILATPNGWDTSQQAFLRLAATKSGWINSKDSHHQPTLNFVTEGEASVHYVLAHQSSNWIAKGMYFMVVDAGGSTVDSTLYECKEITPKLVLQEVCGSECIQAGGVFVDRAAFTILQEKLRASRYGSDEFILEMILEFEKKTKRIFDGSQVNNIINFGRSSDNDRAHDILKGKLSMSTAEVASTYNDVIRRIVSSCQKLLSNRKVKYVVIVGGFGESAYLRKQLEQCLSQQRAEFMTANEPSKKAAAEGAAIWYLRNHVVARATRFTFGVAIDRIYDRSNPQHKARIRDKYTDVGGSERILNGFSVIIDKDKVVKEGSVITRTYIYDYEERPTELHAFSQDILAWSGQGRPGWTTSAQGAPHSEMRTLCTVQADLSKSCPSLKRHTGPAGQKYWRVEYDVCIEFGGTQLLARIQWMEGNKLYKGPATILPTSIPGH